MLQQVDKYNYNDEKQKEVQNELDQ